MLRGKIHFPDNETQWVMPTTYAVGGSSRSQGPAPQADAPLDAEAPEPQVEMDEEDDEEDDEKELLSNQSDSISKHIVIDVNIALSHSLTLLSCFN